MTYQMFDFNAKFVLGIEEVDRDHKELVDMLNKVSALLDEDQLQEAIECFTQKISTYVGIHFAREEAFMEEIDYPGLEKHIEAHRNFQRAYDALKPKIEMYDENAFRKSLLDTFLWLVSHIGKADKEYADYYRMYNLTKLQTN